MAHRTKGSLPTKLSPRLRKMLARLQQQGGSQGGE